MVSTIITRPGFFWMFEGGSQIHGRARDSAWRVDLHVAATVEEIREYAGCVAKTPKAMEALNEL